MKPSDLICVKTGKHGLYNGEFGLLLWHEEQPKSTEKQLWVVYLSVRKKIAKFYPSMLRPIRK